MDNTDALEDWVAIKDHPFLDTNKPSRLEFLVAWNEVDWKIAVTCREKSRVVSDSEAKGWSRLFSLSELQSIHEQLALVHPSLGPLMPSLPEEPRGVWSYITPPDPPSNDLCEKLTTYFKLALDICGRTLLTSTLFEEHDCEEYFENISELRRRAYDEAVARADDELKNVLFLRSGSINMLDMAEVYFLEDKALFKLNIALAELYNYLIQPFLDMREMAFDKLREARNGLKDPDFGKRRKDELAAMFTEWNENYTHALDRIQELYIEYYQKTVDILSDVKARMLEDKDKFGQKTFEVAALDRYNRVCEDLILEKLQLLNNTRRHYENQREKVKQKIASLDAQSITKQLEPLEEEVYSWQRKVCDVQLKISQLEEQLIRARISVLQQKQQDGRDCEFFDAVETEEDLQSLPDCDDPYINEKIKELKKKMAAILKRRAQIRNRCKKLENDKVTKEQHKINEEERFKQHHTVQMKRENQATALEQKHNFIKEERRKTLQRLKEYKMKKHPVPSTIKLRKPQGTRTGRSVKSNHCQDNTDAAETPASPSQSVSPPGVSSEQLHEQPTNHSATSVLDAQQTSGCTDLIPPSYPPPPPPPPCPPPPCPPPPTISCKVSAVSSSLQSDIKSHKELLRSTDTDNVVKGTSGPSTSGISLHHIKDAKDRLRKVNSSTAGGSKSKIKQSTAGSVDPMTDVLQLIKHGVKLRPVNPQQVKDRSEVGSPKHIVPSSDSHTQQLIDAIERISSRLRSESDDEEPTDVFDEFD